MRSLERVNIRTNVRTYVRTYVLTYIRTGQTLYPLHNFVVRGDNKAQRDNKGGSQHKSDSKPSGKPEIKCSNCGMGHLTIKRYKNPDRKIVYSAEVGVGTSGYGGSKGSNSVPKEEAQGMQSKSDNMPSEGNHQLRFCKTEINRKSDEIERSYQSKSESPL